MVGAAGAAAVAVTAIVLAGGRPAVEQAPPAGAARAAQPDGGAPGGPGPESRRIESLAGLLDREVEERLRLEDEIATLRERLASLERELRRDEARPNAAAATEPEPEPQGAGGDRGEVTEGRFVAAGFSEADAAYYRQRLDEAAMARLYLRDQAQREGWLNSPRYREELAALPNVNDELRREMDDETYARFLYATGRPNQVRVRRVLEGSAAAAAGIQAGDVLLRYDGERVYDTRTVQRTTRTGSAGETVAVEILRDGRRVQSYLPRGPIGVTMGAESAPPAGATR